MSARRRARPVPDPLRRDVRRLTTLLGDAIRAHDGPALYRTVEGLRRAVIALHEDPHAVARRSGPPARRLDRAG